MYGTAYCWLIVKPNETDTIDVDSPHQIIQICNTEGEWFDWLERRESNVTAAQMGLFALKSFSKNECICIYAGSSRWKSKEDQSEEMKPIDAFLTEEGVKDSDYCVNVYSPIKKQWLSLDPTYQDGKMYMGAHFIKSATLGFKGSSKVHNKSVKSQNCRIFDNGCVHVIKCIDKGEELYTGYTDASNAITKLEKKRKKTITFTVTLIVGKQKHGEILIPDTKSEQVAK